MKRKMNLLEAAHGLLCNAPGDGGSAENTEHWYKSRTDWISRWEHVIRDQQIKDANKRIQIGNDAIEQYEGERMLDREPCPGYQDEFSAMNVAGPPPNVQIVDCYVRHGLRKLDLNGDGEMCGGCRVIISCDTAHEVEAELPEPTFRPKDRTIKVIMTIDQWEKYNTYLGMKDRDAQRSRR